MKAISTFAPLCLLLAGLTTAPLTAAPIISEFLADSDLGLADEDGDDSDWIEIHNPDATAVDLAGWKLTDDITKPAKWTFPSRTIPPGGYLVVFASEKNRLSGAGNLHTNFRLDPDGEYLALLPPSGPASTVFNPFPAQVHNVSFGRAYVGTVTTTSLTPTLWTAGTNYNRIALSGVGTSVNTDSLNVFDDSLPQPEHQQYLWFNYSSLLNSIPAANTVIEATLSWEGRTPSFAGVSGLSCLPGKIGVFTVPDANKGVTTIATGADGLDLIDYYAATTPVAELTYEVDSLKNFEWNVTQQISDWKANASAPQRGQFMLLPSAQPAWVAWDQNRRGPTLVVRSVNSPTPAIAQGYMSSPTPGVRNVGGSASGPYVGFVTENPPRPDPALATGFVVTAKVLPYQGGAVTSVILTHQKAYAAIATLPMNDAGLDGDAVAGDSFYSATIPASQITAGQMLRWKVTATDATGYIANVPQFRHPIDSPQYFGTVPLEAAVSTNLMVLNWFMQVPTGGDSLTGGRCSIFLNGEFYDNVGINLHGQSTSGATFLKKSYDIDGNRGFRFKWSLDPLKPRAKDINLLTVFADKTKLRHDLAYEMNRLAGVPAHECFLMHVRQNGAFKGLYDFVEDGDDVYLDRAGLNKNGVLYKMYNNMTLVAEHAVAGVEKKSRKQEKNLDLQAFINGMNQTDLTARKRFLMDHVDLAKMINFMAGVTVTGNMDLHAKNYYIYSDSGKSDLWTLLPWDLDLSQGRTWNGYNTYFDDGIYLNPGGIKAGLGQGLVSFMYAIPEFSAMATRRIRSLQDKFFKTSAIVGDPARWYDTRIQQLLTHVGSDATLDYSAFPAALWKNNGAVANNTAASTLASNTMAQEVTRVLNSWVVQRINLVNADSTVPTSQVNSSLLPLDFGVVDFSPVGGNQDQEYIEIRNPNVAAVDVSGWTVAGGVDFVFEPGTILLGKGAAAYSSLYLCKNRKQFKLRTTGVTGNQFLVTAGEYDGHLSSFSETLTLTTDAGALVDTFTYVGAPTPQQLQLVVSEVMYNPAVNNLAEFIEIMNIHATNPVSLTGVKFTQGIDFSFTGSAITSLAPGARCLVVRDLAAFQAIHGSSLPVAGVFALGSVLNNGGESIKLEDGENNSVREFSYSSLAPWPTLADGQGSSLVLINPTSNPDHTLPENWRASQGSQGSPGQGDALPFTGNATDDVDKDGLSALLEYALGTSDTTANAMPWSPESMPDLGTQSFTIRLTRPAGADAVRWCFRVTKDLANPATFSAPYSIISSERGPDGNLIDTIEIPLPIGAAEEASRYFLQGCVQLR